MAERFSGPLVWITMGGALDVRHPDGRTVRTSQVYGEQYDLARKLGKTAIVTVEIPVFVPGAGRFDPRVILIEATPTAE